MKRMRISIAFMTLLFLTGCVGLGGRDSYVRTSDGREYLVRCQSDGKVEYTDGNVRIIVDNRGPLGQVWAAGTASLGKIYDKVKGEDVIKE